MDLDLDVLDAVHRTNIRGTFVVDQQAARRLRDDGAIINFSSSLVDLAFPGYGTYSASKGAAEALTLILARELRGRNITVNAVAPGPTTTRRVPGRQGAGDDRSGAGSACRRRRRPGHRATAARRPSPPE